MDIALTAVIMACLLTASVVFISRAIPPNAPKLVRYCGGGVILAALLVAVGFYGVLGSVGQGDAPLAGRSAELAQAQARADSIREEASLALTEAQAALAQNPDSIEAQFALADAAARIGDGEVEIATLKAIFNQINAPALGGMIAEAIARQADGIITPESLAWIDRTLAATPDDWRARYLKGLYFSQMGADETALGYWIPLARDNQDSPFFTHVVDAIILGAERAGIDLDNLDSLAPIIDEEETKP